MNKIFLVIVFLIVTLMALTALGAEATYRSAIVHAALKHGVDPTLALAIAEVESGFNPRAKGSKGELGIYQLRPEFHGKPKTTSQNITVAMEYLAKIKKDCYPKYGSAYFVCYNFGPNRRLKVAPSATDYYQKVFKAYSRRRAQKSAP